jgi:Zn-dependent protease
MNRNTIPLGRILGIPIGLDYSWFLVFVLLTWTLAVGYFPDEFKNWPVAEYWIAGAITAIMLFVSVLLHELGHSVVAKGYNMPVRRITLFIFGGIAEIGAEPPKASAEFWIAIAGPFVSLILAVLFALLSPLTLPIPVVFAIVSYLAFINAALVVFNLIPGFPLDGGRVLRAILWAVTENLEKATVVAGSVGRVIGFLFIIGGVWLIFSVSLIDGLWIAFIGWFLESAAASQVRYQMITSLLAGRKVSDAMSTNFVEIPADASLQQLVDHHILGSGQRSFVVTANSRVVGLLTLHHVKEVPRDRWAATTVGQAMIPADQMKRVGPDVELQTALTEMDSDGVNQLPVMADGDILGMLTRENIISLLRTLHELGTQ